MNYDFSDPYTLNKVRTAVGGMLTRWLVRRLRKFDGVVRARLDWFAGQGVAPLESRVVHVEGHATDHDAVVVDVAI